MGSGIGVELPRYTCHKEVWALKIKAIEPVAFPPCEYKIGHTSCGYGPNANIHLGSSDPVQPPMGRHKYTASAPIPPDIAAMVQPEEKGYAPFPISHEYVARHQPQVGGYYVVYKDGYKSFSPAAAFEEGYSRI
jgi:hypothetical protein